EIIGAIGTSPSGSTSIRHNSLRDSGQGAGRRRKTRASLSNRIGLLSTKPCTLTHNEPDPVLHGRGWTGSGRLGEGLFVIGVRRLGRRDHSPSMCSALVSLVFSTLVTTSCDFRRVLMPT